MGILSENNLLHPNSLRSGVQNHLHPSQHHNLHRLTLVLRSNHWATY